MRSSPPVAPGRQRRHPQPHHTIRGVITTVLLTAVTLLAGNAVASATPPTDTITAGHVLHPGEQLMAANGYHADMQGDGNFVVYPPSGPFTWSTKTANNHAGASLSVQGDGNVVLYAPNHAVLFTTHTASTDPVPSSLTMQTDGNLVLSAAGQPLWSSKYGAASCFGSGCPVLSSYETQGHGSLAGRDCGYSQQLGTTNQSMWLFCDTPVVPTGGSLGFIPGSTAATGAFHAGFASQALNELPSGLPHQLLNTPTNLPLKPSGVCGTGGHSYAASWATGMTAIPGSPTTMLIPFENYCVQNDAANKGMWFQGYGIAEYDSTTKALSYHQDVMTGNSYLHQLGSPTYDAATNYLYFFAKCAPFQCTTPGTFVARVALGANPAVTKPWTDGMNYEFWKGTGWSAHSTGAVSVLPSSLTAWNIHVNRYPAFGNQLVMVTQSDFSGGYQILTATSPLGPWTVRTTGRNTSCPVPTEAKPAYCYAFVGHPELSTPTQLAITMFNPTYSHVTLQMIPW